jgi:hypothetical protein
MCQPITLAQAQGSILGFAIDNANAYWTDWDAQEIMTVPKGGGTPAPLATGQIQPDSLAIGGGAVFWTTWVSTTGYGYVMSMTLDGGAPTIMASDQVQPSAICTDGASVYWIECPPGQTCGSALDAANLYDLSLATGKFGTFALDISSLGSTVVDSTNVYITNPDTGVVEAIDRQLGTVTTIAQGQNEPMGIAVDAVNVYWTDTNGTVMSYALDGGATATIAAGQSSPNSVAVDSTFIYWTDVGNGTVQEAPLNGSGPVVTLASAQTGASLIAVDQASVYWVDSPSDASGSAVMKVAK